MTNHQTKQDEILKGCGNKYSKDDFTFFCNAYKSCKGIRLCKNCKQKALSHKIELQKQYDILMQTRNYDRAKVLFKLLVKYDEVLG